MNICRKASQGGLAAVMTVAIAAAVGTAGMVTPTPAHAQWTTVCVNCSTWMSQLMQYAKEVQTALSTAQSLQTQIQQYDNMVKQGIRLSNPQFSNAIQSLRQLNSLVAQGRNIAYSTSNLQSQFKHMFPDFKQYLQDGVTWKDAQGAYGKWSNQTKDASLAALRAAHVQMNNIANGNGVQLIHALQQQSTSAPGRMAAIQAGNGIAIEQVKQLQKLRQLLATQIQLQANVVANKQRQRDMQRAVIQNQYSSPAPETGGYKPFEHMGTAPANH